MDKEDYLYKVNPFFMVRRPLLPFNFFEKIESGENFLDSLELLVEDNQIREAILVASPSLYQSIDVIKKENRDKCKEKKLKQVSNSLVKYISRMSTRATPFGLFSGVCEGNVTDEKKIVFEAFDEVHKRTRPDMEWLLAYVHQLENRIDILNFLKVKWNPATQNVGERIELRAATYCGQGNKHQDSDKDTISIRGTEAVYFVRDLSKKEIIYSDLIKQFVKKYENELDKADLEKFVYDLFFKEFLISDLRPPLTQKSPLSYLRNHLSNIDYAIKEINYLDILIRLVREYDQLQIGEGIQKYQDIIEFMSEKISVKNYLQVDFSYPNDKFLVPSDITNRVGEISHILWKLSTQGIGFSHIRDYYIDFIEQYGTSRDVPLLELVNSETGLGYPKAYSSTNNSFGNNYDNKKQKITEREKFLWQQMLYSIKDNSLEINLNDESIGKLIVENKNPQYATNSFEIYADILENQSNSLNGEKYQIVLNPNSGSYQAGLSFGRFTDLLGSETKEYLQAVNQRIQDSCENVIMAEGSLIPTFGKIANVMISENLYDYEVSIGNHGNPAKQQINLDDLYVAANENHLILKSKKFNKEIRIMASNMLNFAGSTNLYRFLREISLDMYSQWQPFEWGSLMNSPVLPRVVYKNVIVSPRAWNISIQDFLSTEIQTGKNWIDTFHRWMEMWSIPRYVQLEVADNHILLDLSKKEYLEELRKRIQNDKSVKLRELVGDFSERLKLNQKKYAVECVFEVEKQRYDRYIANNFDFIRTEELESLMNVSFDEWVYMKIYIGKYLQPEFISNHLVEFIKNLINKKYINKWFYIIYEDPEPHIRVRLFLNSQMDYAKFMEELNGWCKLVTEQYAVKKINFDTFEKEIGRYGGPHLTECVEEVFKVDSEVCAEIVRINRYNLSGLPEYILGVMSILDYLSDLDITIEEQSAFLNLIGNKDEYRKEYREWKNILFEYLAYDNDLATEIHQILSHRKECLLEYKSLLVKDTSKLWNSVDNIIASLLHMNCNRIFGTDRSMEEKVLSIARHLMKDWTQYQKYKMQTARKEK
ncbi:lantibiotic dehydratase [Listeria monocytogenes]|nr:lantibiotic dehydratase [Listeria monocytogenes]EII2166243.1 lantibiotic dehydratase [Listeria monocytogenes]EII2287561.1 lantibiotic dehydratase [Listeria monocytogenes]